jgi:4-diphosphocytidyl-2-C-methyl-D-erythritol kinase
MIVYPNAKINLGLRVLRRHANGFHDLETVFCPIGWSDLLEVVPVSGVRYRVRLSLSGLALPGSSRHNLVRRAALVLQERYRLPALRLHLHKQIPAGAGLGGGSSDAAFTLRALMELFSLDIREEELRQTALMLGSDVPFFLMNRPALARGRGEQLTPLPLSLQYIHLLVIYPGLHMPTGQMFRHITPSEEGASLQEILSLPLQQWRDKLINDFETAAGELHPVIPQIIRRLYDAGALYASLSGSGSAVYGLFLQDPPTLTWPEEYLVWQERLKV